MVRLTEQQAIDYVNIESKRLSETHSMGYYWSVSAACQVVASKYELDAVALRESVLAANLN